MEAGRVLAAAVRKDLDGTSFPGNTLVLAIPRGGVRIGRLVAAALDGELDIVVPRKLGAPGNPEYALGAVMHDGTLYLNQEALRMTGATPEFIETEKVAEMREANRRLLAFRDAHPQPVVSGRVVVVVDDGIATGATMIAAVRWVKSKGSRKVVVAAPVAPPSTIRELRLEADLVVCPHAPEPFHAIGSFYERFDQVGDDEVEQILREYWSRSPSGNSSR